MSNIPSLFFLSVLFITPRRKNDTNLNKLFFVFLRLIGAFCATFPVTGYPCFFLLTILTNSQGLKCRIIKSFSAMSRISKKMSELRKNASEFSIFRLIVTFTNDTIFIARLAINTSHVVDFCVIQLPTTEKIQEFFAKKNNCFCSNLPILFPLFVYLCLLQSFWRESLCYLYSNRQSLLS